jgi:L-aminoadipate-semialdehyde dehydrogenase
MTPGALARWVAKYGVTITHLTPAMGQLLTANATTSMPTLRVALFVGDVLTKRDVRRLQALAPNLVAVNMYGTTETQRAVSYLVRRKDTGRPPLFKFFGARLFHGTRHVQIMPGSL